MFTEWYGNAAERRWADAAALPLPSDRLTAGTTTGDAAQLPANITRAQPPMPPLERMHQIVAAEEAARGGDDQVPPFNAAESAATAKCTWNRRNDRNDEHPAPVPPPVVSKGERKEHEEAEAQIESRRRKQHLIEEQIAREEAARGGDAAQLPAGSTDATARLMPEHVVAIQQEEAARGPPRLLHELAADAFDTISNGPTWATFNLDAWFPWMQYVAAHTQSAAIIGPGITHAHAVFVPGTNDPNRGGAPRLDFCFTRTDGTVYRVHPGRRTNLH